MYEVKEVLKAEKEAETILFKAQKEADNIVTKSKQDSLSKIALEKEQIKVKLDQELKSKTEKLEKEQKHILDEATGKVLRLENSAKKNFESAEKLLLNKVLLVD